MPYKRKTRIEFIVEGYFSPATGWEVVYEATSAKEARERVKEYRENDTRYVYRWRRRTVKIEATTKLKGE